MRYAKSTDHLFSELEKSLLSARLAKKGDTVVVLSGTPPTRRGVTNMMKLHRIE
jgi:pyruvate kinase